MAMSGVVRFIFLLTVVWGSCLVRGKVSLLTLSDEDFNRESVGSSVQNNGGYRIQSVSLEEAVEQLEARSRFRRATTSSHTTGSPSVYGNYAFSDNNTRATIHYSGLQSPVIFVLTYKLSNQGQPINSKLYRSADYGKTFSDILSLLDKSEPPLWYSFSVSPVDNKKVVFRHATKSILYYSTDEGQHWHAITLSPSTLDLRTLVWNPVNDNTALAHDPTTDKLYVTKNFGKSWTKIADNVDDGSGFQWGDPNVDEDHTMVYFNAYDPSDHKSGSNVTVSLYTQHDPYTSATLKEFDPSLGRHDDFLLLGPYIYAQKTDSKGVRSLYISYQRGKFNQARIPSTQGHQNYLVSHIDALQALVVIQHTNGQFNLYLSDITAVYFSLSLPGITHNGGVLDLDIVDGVNGTLMANQYIGGGSSGPTRSLISLDNGANWELVRPPSSSDCSPPQCSLHLHMRTTSYGRTAIYSQASAPGLIVAHGNTGQTLSSRPDLYISRDGGVTWSLTLQGSWGVTVLDHGGLLVAAKDYHQEASNLLQYSCDEGKSWSTFNFSSTQLTVFGVITEPGEHTAIVSLYGTARQDHTWDVISVDFGAVFSRNCSSADFYLWHPWDDRTKQPCLLGSMVAIERRNSSICCLIGRDYSRPVQFSKCSCTEDDFECGYGYQHSDGFTGDCVRDTSVVLDPICTGSNPISYMKSQGYQKVAGDVCVGGVQEDYLPIETACSVSSSGTVAIIVLSVLLALFILTTVLLAVSTSYFLCKLSRVSAVERVRRRAPRVQFQPTGSETSSRPVVQQPLLNPSAAVDDDDDDDPLAL